MTLRAYISGIGALGPGFANWLEAVPMLSGQINYTSAPSVLPMPTLLPSAERRRTGRVVKVAIAVALEATARAGVDPAALASVFSSSGGDGHNCHEICQALALESREISPTRFSNSVHNAAAGYWSIATGAKLESNVLCAFDASFCAGLLEALVQVVVEDESVLLVAYDTEYPEPLHSKRPIPDAFGAALVLTPQRNARSIARIEAELEDCGPEYMAEPGLESLRNAIPAARCLPLLKLLADGRGGKSALDYLGPSRVVVQVEPCI